MMTLSLSLLDTPAYTYTHTHTSTLTSGNKDNLHDDLDGQPVCTVPNVQAKILKSQLTTEFTTRNCLKLTFSEFIAAAAAAVLDTKFAARQGAQEKRDTHMHTPTTPANRRAATTTLNKREAHMDGDTIGNTNKQGGRTLRVGQIVEHVSKQYRAVVLGHTM